MLILKYKYINKKNNIKENPNRIYRDVELTFNIAKKKGRHVAYPLHSN